MGEGVSHLGLWVHSGDRPGGSSGGSYAIVDSYEQVGVYRNLKKAAKTIMRWKAGRPDRNAGESVACLDGDPIFGNAFTSNLKCAPSLSPILLGRFPWHNEEACNHLCYFPNKFPLLPDILNDHEYFTGYTNCGYSPTKRKILELNEQGVTYYHTLAFGKRRIPCTKRVRRREGR